MKFTLHWKEPETGEEIEADFEPPIRIGRDLSGDVVLSGDRISRRHAQIRLEADTLVAADMGSTNGTTLNGEPLRESPLNSGDILGIGDFEIRVTFSTRPAGETAADQAATILDTSTDPLPDAYQGTLVFQEGASDLTPFTSDIDETTAGAFPPDAFSEDPVPLDALRAAGYTFDETTYLALGGGLGSFIWVDHLLIYGADPDHVVSIGLEEVPYARYARLCRNSQIPNHERLRSDSASCPDNIWGWPGYAVREIWGSLKKFELANAVRVAWSIFNEPVFGPVYTPRAGDVFNSIDREMTRIRWDRIFRYGRIKAIRKTDDGRYVIAYSQSSQEEGRVNRLILARYVHLSMGYPGVRFLQDLQAYRESERDFTRVVNAYEDHEHVYEDLRSEGGTVLIRGRGIVASRIIQRLHELRAEQPDIGILHLMRSPNSEGARYQRSKRGVDNHWEFQPYNWPKSCWGGELRDVLENASREERDRLYDQWGGTTTANRSDWRRIVETGLRESWYQIRFGGVKAVTRNDEGRLVTILAGRGALQDESRLTADYILDCTGLEADLEASPILHDLVSHHGLGRNPKGRLDVANDFRLIGMDSGRGRMYASGAMTLGGPYAPVDSFLGLQYTAQRSVDALAANRAPGLRRLNGFSSAVQWFRWAQGRQP